MWTKSNMLGVNSLIMHNILCPAKKFLIMRTFASAKLRPDDTLRLNLLYTRENTNSVAGMKLQLFKAPR